MSIIKALKMGHDYLKYTGDNTEPEKECAIECLDMDIEEGEFVAILGHNGSGKSTLAKHFNALLLPSRGTVWVAGMDTSKEDDTWKIRQKAGMVFQNPDNQIVATVVEEDVAFGPENLSVPTKDIWHRVDDALEKVGMTAYRDRSPNHLSGGQKQRVAIAGVVAMRPSCIIMDEPTAMLDPNGRKEVLRVVHELNKQEHITVILITHYMEEVVDADRVYVMDKGKVVMQGTPREIFSQVDTLKSYRLDVPDVVDLVDALNKGGMNLPSDILTKEELVKALGQGPAKAAAGSETQATAKSDCQGTEAICDGAADTETTASGTCQEPVATSCGTETTDLCADHDSAATSSDVSCAETTSKEDGKKCLLEMKDVTYLYGENTVYQVKALDKINLKINEGEFTALIGHTGSGKSTLIQHLNGLVKPSSGQILWQGQDIFGDGFDRRKLRSQVGLVFQYPEHQLFETTILADVMFGPLNQGFSKEEAEKKAKNALTLTGISPEMYEESPFDISGGQKRRV
ncbi:MAG: energy-coupling factor transporter ATPase, partial [Lachnospiraceae bacterium]|nr:energy-coupling factor transporter ATPase [Candidatus Equihabitans merdae]